MIVPSDIKVIIPSEALNLLREILYFLQGGRQTQVWLVGGSVRDLARGSSTIFDLDLAISENPAQPAQEYARNKKAGFVVLDEEHQIARVVKSVDSVNYTVDLARFRADTIEDDLNNRDFSINAMAIKLQWPLLGNEFPIFDPLNGLDHLKDSILVPCSDNLFRDDPLRLLRAFRFASIFSMEFSSFLVELMKRDSELLTQSSWERIRDEFFKILSSRNSSGWIKKMSELGLLKNILPELESSKGVDQNRWHHLDVFDHTLLALTEFESFIEMKNFFDNAEKFHKFLDEPISGTRTYKELFKFACLLHDLGKPACKRSDDESNKIIFHGHEMEGVRLCEIISERFKLSSNEIHFLAKVVKNHMRPGVIIQDGLSDRRLFRYYSETGRDGVGIALMSLADRKAAKGEESSGDMGVFETGIKGIMSDFYRQMEYAKKPLLITGTDLITDFHLAPGPRFKEILEMVKEAQHLGKINTKKEAIQFVAKLLSSSHY